MKLLLLLLLLTGCAAQRLVISQIDNIIEFQTGSKLSLYYRQKDALEKDVTTYLKGLQKEVPGWKVKLAALDLKKPETLDSFWDDLQNQYLAVSKGYVHVLAKYLALLDAKQQISFFEAMKEENDEIRESPAQRNKLAERVEFFFGEVSTQQEQVISDNMPLLKERQMARLKRREELHAKLKAIYATTGAKEEKIRTAFDAYQERLMVDQQPLFKMYRDLCRGLTTKQEMKFKERQKEMGELLDHFARGNY